MIPYYPASPVSYWFSNSFPRKIKEAGELSNPPCINTKLKPASETTYLSYKSSTINLAILVVYAVLMQPIDKMSISSTSPPYPLHPSVKDLLDPEYVAFYNAHVIDKQQVHLQPVETSRTSGILIPGGGPLVDVGKTVDITIKRRATEGPEILLRAFTPIGEAPEGGWPVMLYFHGGGWVLGNIDTENVVCTNLCSRGGCVVVTVDYRYLGLRFAFVVRSSTTDGCFVVSHRKTPGQRRCMIAGNPFCGCYRTDRQT